LYLCYGNSSVTASQENAAGVWDADYKGVWHMEGMPGGANDIPDSTADGVHGTTGNMDSADQVAGKIGGSLDFDNVDDYVDTSLTDLGANTLTYSVWIKPRTAGQGGFGRIFEKYLETILFLYDDAGECKIQFEQTFSTSWGIWRVGSIALNAWQYIVVTYDRSSTGNDPDLYINGELQSKAEISTPSGSMSTNGNAVQISKHPYNTR
ncbi:hypothetical protein D1BOALGB6SA_6956, partial [Olavius sp. associated proteobacterium Delta 1]